MVAPIRLTPQTQQARRSIRQIAECFEAFGWVVTPPSEDLGEDFIAHIYFDGRATGVLFHIQAKSITNLQERKRQDYLPYRFEVKDLSHWSQFALPVILLIWDTQQQEGRWVIAKEAIFQLEKKNPNWHAKKTATIRIPWSHTTDDSGLKQLRQAIGRQLVHQLTHGKTIQVSLRPKFSDDPQGREALQQFEAYLKEGQSVTLTEKFIAKIEMSPWFQTWFGKPSAITLGPNIYDSPIPLKLELLTNEKPVPPQYIEGILQSGQELITISNHHQKSHPLHFKISFAVDKIDPLQIHGKQIQVTCNHYGRHVEETIQTETFIRALCQGGQLFISSPNYSNFHVLLDLEPNQQLVQRLQPDTHFDELLQKLYDIQKRFRHPFQVPRHGFSLDDVHSIVGLWHIIKTGKTKAFATDLTLRLNPESPDFARFLRVYKEQEAQNNVLDFMLSYQDGTYKVLGKPIDTGAWIRYITCKPTVPYQQLLAQLQQQPAKPLTLTGFTDVEITDVYPDFYLQEAKRLATLVQDNYAVDTIYLFGSLARNQGFTRETDIDLAITGISDWEFTELLDYLEQATQFTLNVIELEYAPSILQKRILEEGVKLYEAQPVAVSG